MESERKFEWKTENSLDEAQLPLLKSERAKPSQAKPGPNFSVEPFRAECLKAAVKHLHFLP